MNSHDLAKNIRLIVLKLCFEKKASHIGGALSIADVLGVLYSDFMSIDSKNPKATHRDRLFYSKGHACTALYAALYLKGFFTDSNFLETFTEDGSYFTSHINHNIAGVELSTGSLGHALSVACGVAIAGKRFFSSHSVVTILSDGELNEGSNWEAFLFAPHHQLDNLIVIVDYNKIQSFGRISEVLNLEPLGSKFNSFNWDVTEINGHNHDEIKNALMNAKALRNKKPKMIIAHTVKGKGVSFMQDKLAWHYKSPNAQEYALAVQEVEGH
jgi:transketolase